MFCSTFMFGQKYSYETGCKFVKKADKNLKKGNLQQAEKLIAKAYLSNYAFCGADAFRLESAIIFIDLQVVLKQKKFDRTFFLLDSTHIGNFIGNNKRDSLKIMALFSKYGKEKVRNSFKGITKVTEKTGNFGQILYSVDLNELNYTFCFEKKVYFDKNGQLISEIKTENEFYDKAKKTAFYKLLE